MDLVRFAVSMVRKNGDVLEHPSGSRLWPDQGLPEPGYRDNWDRWTLAAPQFWWGHRAEKATRFYVVGRPPAATLLLPYAMGNAPLVITQSIRRGQPGFRSRVTSREREATPPALAHWLVELARRCTPQPLSTTGGLTPL